MNVAIVTETYPPEINGVAMTIQRLAAGLAGRGHRVEIVRPRQAGDAAMRDGRARTDETGVTHAIVRGCPIPFYSGLRVGLPERGSLAKRWRAARPDVVHLVTEGPLGWTALRTARRLGIPVTSSFHTNFHQYGGHYGLRLGRGLALGYLRRFHNRTGRTLVPTEEIAVRLKDSGFQRLGVLARGVDAELFSPARRSADLRAGWGAGPEDLVAIYVGRLAPEKNLGLVADAFAEMRAMLPSMRMVMVGGGPSQAALQARYPEFHYAGVRRGEDLAAHYASADVLLFASITETFGNVITEAMAGGLATIAYDYAAARRHVRNGVNGFTATYDDPAALREAARLALSRRAEWPAIRREARATACSLSWETVVTEFADVLSAAALSGAKRERCQAAAARC